MDRDYSSLLPQVLSKLFPDASTREHAARILSSYGRESFHLEVERVHLGILKLSGADLSAAIEGWTQFACDDFRDLLIETEYPPQLRERPVANGESTEVRSTREEGPRAVRCLDREGTSGLTLLGGERRSR